MKTAFLDILFFVTLQFLSRYCVDLTMLVQDGAIFLSCISPWDSGSQTGSELWVGERESEIDGVNADDFQSLGDLEKRKQENDCFVLSSEKLLLQTV